MTKNYMADHDVRNYYDKWISGPTLLDHAYDRGRFYEFIKACVAWAGHERLRQKLDTSYLKACLYDDLHSKYSQEAYEDIRDSIIALFEELLDYQDTAFP